MHTLAIASLTGLCTLLFISGDPSHSGGDTSGYPEGPTQPNLKITSVAITDSEGEPISPQAGEPFWLRVDYEYSNPGCSRYTIERTVNGFTNSSESLDWGCGETGTTNWSHLSGSWLMHRGGTYEVSVNLDSGNTIAEAEEIDNLWTFDLEVGGSVSPEWALVEADAGRVLLGDGTGVVVGSMDDAVDFHHPWLAGNDSLGRPRLVAANQNTLGPNGRPLNANHATAVMGIVLSRGANDGDLTGMAPDARYVVAEFYNRDDIPGLTPLSVFDAAGFLVNHGAEVINMSWSWFLDPVEARSGEGALTNLMADYLAYGLNIVCVPAVNQIPDVTSPTAPGAARNTISVGGLDDSLTRAWSPQNHGPTADGRSKPDLLGNDAESTLSIRPGWADGRPVIAEIYGTSFAVPFVTGAVAQLLDYGKSNGENTDHRVMKAVVMNSGVKALDADGTPWDNSAIQALDDEQGTGILNMVRAHAMYSAGQQNGDVQQQGYDLRTVSGTTSGQYPTGRVIYRLGAMSGTPGQFDATLVWDRHTFWDDANGDGQIDASDSFYTRDTDTQDNLDLVLYKNGLLIASSRSTVDNVEHLSIPDLGGGIYELHVERRYVPSSGDEEEFAIAWLSEGNWTQDYTRASYTPFGVGCPGSNGTPVLEQVPGSNPWVEGTLRVRITNLSRTFSFGTVFMAVGISKTEWGGVSLPIALGDMGLWGCTGYTSVDVAFPLVSFLGTATWNFDIPRDFSLVGMPFYNQGYILDPAANPAGAIVSNAAEALIGGRVIGR